MVSKLFRAIAKRVRQIGASLAEKSNSSVDEHELEHFLLYHGLVGSSPENQRSYRDVRADIKIAVQETNSLKMGIALKVAPLWWEDKLKTIFKEIADQEGKARSVSTLLPEMADETWPNRFDPLGHQEWHVRSNAALVLAFLEAQEAAPRMIRSLHDSASGVTKTAFAHIAYALGKLGAEPGKAALEQYLYHEEDWFRVDAAGALSHWPVSVTGETLMRAMSSYFALSDYMAVAISKRHKPIEYLRSHSSTSTGACAMVLGLLDAARQTFSTDLVSENGVWECITPIIELACKDPTPLNVRAALALAEFAESEDGIAQQDAQAAINPKLIAELRATVASTLVTDVVSRYVQSAETKQSDDLAQLRSAIILAGDLKIVSLLPSLIKMLEPQNPLLDVVVDTLGKIGDASAAAPLLKLANNLVSMSQRTGLPLSKQPVADDDPGKSKSYWSVLKALGEIKAPLSVPFLLEAANDFAPDKRDQALNSLLNVFALQNGNISHRTEFKETIARALSDPSPQCRTTALEGVSALGDADFVEEVLKMTESPEVSVSRKAFATLDALWEGDQKEKISAAINAAIAAQNNKFRKGQLEQFLAERGR